MRIIQKKLLAPKVKEIATSTDCNFKENENGYKKGLYEGHLQTVI